MKVIKFRAWHYEHKVMIEWEKVQEHSMNFLFGYGTVNMLQYTGLKDKNGKEIYEGDVVKGKTYLGNMEVFSRFIGEVKYYAPKFELDGVNKYKRCREDLNSSFEVIGNIYENSNLLGLAQSAIESNEQPSEAEAEGVI